MVDALHILDIRETADLLRLNEQTVRRLARERRIPAFKVGSEWRFHSSVLDRWCQHQCSQSGGGDVPTILILDDDAAVRDSLSRLLTWNGYRCTVAENGEEGLRLISENGLPHLVILDLNMPVLDGAEFLARAQRWPELPVIVLTGYPDSDLMARALTYSPVLFLSKPFEAAQIQRALQQTLGRRPVFSAGQ